jgi:DNA-binding transcriptional ArsR family regulator
MTAQADDELWSAIADPSRRQVLDLLVSNGDVSASWLAGHVPFSRQAVSKHLAVLEQAGLVSRRKQGREVLYQVQAGRLDQATRAMADLAARWDRRLATIKRLAEAAHAQANKAKAPALPSTESTESTEDDMKDGSANPGGPADLTRLPASQHRRPEPRQAVS